MLKLAPFAGVARAPFLLLPFTLIAAGAAAAFYDGAFSWRSTLLALLGLVSLHAAVNAFNEWSDMRTGIDLATQRTPFSGGSGTLPAGGMSVRTALVFAIACSLLGLAVGIWFLGRVGLVLLPIMVAGALCVLIYTDVLARLGIGEVPATFMTFNLLLLNEFPDEAADRAGGRRNLVVLFGRRPAALAWAAAAVATPLSIVAAVGMSILPLPCLAACLPSLLLVGPMRWVVSDPMQPVPIPAMGANVAWNLATNTVLAIALVVATLF